MDFGLLSNFVCCGTSPLHTLKKPRDHFWRSTSAPRRSWPTMWNEFLPISMPITAILLLSFSDMACSFVFGAPCQFGSLARLEHGRTIPFSDMAAYPNSNQRALMITIEASRHFLSRPQGAIYV